MQNGDLLNEAVKEGYELMITTDQNLRYQQNLSTRNIQILVLCTTSWPRIRQNINAIVEALNRMPENGYQELRF